MGNRTCRRGGFTLVEVLLVIVILGMLATLAIVNLLPTRESAKIQTTKLLIDQVGSAMERYAIEIGHYPTESEGGLEALLKIPSFENEKLTEKWRGPYLKKEAEDQWDNPLNYEPVEAGEAEALTVPYKLWSSGPDGQSGTEDDIKNWSEESAT